VPGHVPLRSRRTRRCQVGGSRSEIARRESTCSDPRARELGSLTCQACSYHPGRALVAWTTPSPSSATLVTLYSIRTHSRTMSKTATDKPGRWKQASASMTRRLGRPGPGPSLSLSLSLSLALSLSFSPSIERSALGSSQVARTSRRSPDVRRIRSSTAFTKTGPRNHPGRSSALPRDPVAFRSRTCNETPIVAGGIDERIGARE